MHITINYHDHVVIWVLIDEKSRLNIFPLSTLAQMGSRLGEIHQRDVSLRSFDGEQRGGIGDIDLYIQLGPIKFNYEFHVMDINPSYKLLLGWLWIYNAG